MKLLKITNGTEYIQVECTNKLNTKISEECMIELGYKSKINPEEIILKILLEELRIKNKEDWKLCG